MTDIRGGWVLFSLVCSIIFHFFIFLPFLKPKNDNVLEKISVVNLGEYRQVYKPERKKKFSTTQNRQTEEKVTEENKVPKEKKKEKIKRDLAKPQSEQNEPKRKVTSKPIEKILEEEIINKDYEEEVNKAKNKLQKVINEDLINQRKNVFQSDPNLKKTQDSQLRAYLLKVSENLNIQALNSYPIQSQRRREEGTIVVRIILGRKGNLISFVTLTKRPKRLVKAAAELIEKFKNFEPPPKHLFLKEDKFRFEINLNYRLGN